MVWFLVGVLVSIPYTLLADGSLIAFAVTAFLSPVALFLLAIAFILLEERGVGGYTWIPVVYLCLPILLNGISIALRVVGYVATADLVHGARYWSLLVVLVIAVLCWLIAVKRELTATLPTHQRFTSGR